METRFRWDGKQFDQLSTSYQLVAEPDLYRFCEAVVDHAASNWGPAAARDLLQQLTADQDARTAVPISDALRDKWQFQLAVAEAL